MGIIRKNGICRICKRRGYTEWHHIVSQGHAIRTNQLDLLANSGNMVELCKHHHNQTTASMVRKRLLKEGVPMRTRSARSKRARHRRLRLSDYDNSRRRKQ